MHKHYLDQFGPLGFALVIVLLVAGAGYYAWSIFTPARQNFVADDPAAIAKYKVMLRDNDLPFVGGKIKPQELPEVYCRIIEGDLKAGDAKSARGYIGEAIRKKLDAQVLALVQSPETKALIGQVQAGQRKVEALNQFTTYLFAPATLQGRGQEQVEAELTRLADAFCQLPFQPAACPEQAEEIGRTYREMLQPLVEPREPERKVMAEIDRSCRLPAVGK